MDEGKEKKKSQKVRMGILKHHLFIRNQERSAEVDRAILYVAEG